MKNNMLQSLTRDNWQYIFLTGATASGKSSLAIKLALEYDAYIINCDSMQIYDALPIITARPTKHECSLVEHKLFGYVSPNISYSVGKWLKDVKDVIKGRPEKVIFVGGTGLYYTGLLGGISYIPDIDLAVRDYWRAQYIKKTSEELHSILLEKDPAIINKISASDKQRIVRALEVITSTGKSIIYWQNQPSQPLIDKSKVKKFVLDLERTVIYNNINKRFDKMVDAGALIEVEDLLNKNLSEDLPIMRAIGFKELAQYLCGDIDIKCAIELAKTKSRQYAKRQITWQRHQLGDDWLRVEGW